MSQLSPDLTSLSLRDAETSESVTITPRRLIVAGYTGRDSAHVRTHIRELEAMGIAPPLTVPMFYELPVSLLTCSSVVSVESHESSGEVEAVLLGSDGRWWVGVGSDHTARDIERDSVPLSKRACPKIVGPDVILYESVRGAWDEIRLRSWAQVPEGEELLYQDGVLGHLLPLPAVLGEFLAMRPVELEGLVVFLGTVPLTTGRFVFADCYRMELQPPGGVVPLAMRYEVRTGANA